MKHAETKRSKNEFSIFRKYSMINYIINEKHWYYTDQKFSSHFKKTLTLKKEKKSEDFKPM